MIEASRACFTVGAAFGAIVAVAGIGLSLATAALDRPAWQTPVGLVVVTFLTVRLQLPALARAAVREQVKQRG